MGDFLHLLHEKILKLNIYLLFVILVQYFYSIYILLICTFYYRN